MSWDDRYRMLKMGEIIKKNDECLTESHLGWKPAGSSVGQCAPDPLYSAHRMYRRKKSSEQVD